MTLILVRVAARRAASVASKEAKTTAPPRIARIEMDTRSSTRVKEGRWGVV